MLGAGGAWKALASELLDTKARRLERKVQMKLQALALLGIVAKVGGDGCDPLPEKACTAIGCEDGVSITVRPREGTFPPGKHSVLIATAEGGPIKTCTFTAPADVQVAGGFVAAECTGGVMLSVSPRTTCTTMRTGDSVSQACTPIPGQFEERIFIRGTPARVRVIQKTEETFLDRELTPSYANARPNGPECEPVCRQASTEWEFSATDRPTSEVACSPSQCSRDSDCAALGRPAARCIQKPWSGPCIQLACE
jgi:hypothetical protein